MAKCFCTHRLLNIDCFERVVRHNVQFSCAVKTTIKHECMKTCCFVIGKRQELNFDDDDGDDYDDDGDEDDTCRALFSEFICY